MFFRATVGDHTYEIEIEGDVLTIDGEACDYVFERIADGRYALLLDGRSVSVFLEPLPDGRLRVTRRDRTVDVDLKDRRALLMERYGMERRDLETARVGRAPMPGLVLSVHVAPGQEVRQGDGLLVLEAMKMENELQAAGSGTVKAVHVSPGQAVGKNALLLEVEP